MGHARAESSGHRRRKSSGASLIRERAPTLRLVVVGRQPARIDVLAQALRRRGARVVVAEPSGAGLEAARRLDPHAIALARSPGERGVIEMLRNDPILRWAFVIPFRWRALVGPGGVVDPAPILERAEPWLRQERTLLGRLREHPVVHASLGLLGPGRLLRALADTRAGVRIEIAAPGGRGVIDVEAGSVCAKWWPEGEARPRFTGAAAVAAFLAADEAWLRFLRGASPGPDAERVSLSAALAWAAANLDEVAHDAPTRPRLRLVSPPPEPAPAPPRSAPAAPRSWLPPPIPEAAPAPEPRRSALVPVLALAITSVLLAGAGLAVWEGRREPMVRTWAVRPAAPARAPAAASPSPEPEPELAPPPEAELPAAPAPPPVAGEPAWAESGLPPLSLLRAAGRGLPRNPRVARIRSDAILREARDAEAPGPALHRAFVTAPNNPHAAEALARWHLAAGRHEVALAFARWAARQRRANAPYRQLVGDVLDAMGRHAEARAAWEAAHRLDPELPERDVGGP